MAGKEYDFMLFGATGYTGRLCAQFITKNHNANTRWAVAGRSVAALECLVNDLNELNPDRIPPVIVTFTKLEQVEVEPLVQKTCVVINGIGPFHRFSTPIVAACAKSGTHYIDFTTETLWMRDIIKKYEKLAIESDAVYSVWQSSEFYGLDRDIKADPAIPGCSGPIGAQPQPPGASRDRHPAQPTALAISSFHFSRPVAAHVPSPFPHLVQCWGLTLSAQPKMAAVNRNMFDASVRTDQIGNGSLAVVALPLNLVAHIVSYVEEPGDLARMCRTCRLFNYMALPHLYRNISLTSYDRIRYRNEQPEGWGSASPFLMGLDVLVTKPQAALVRSMTLRGNWKEPDLEEHSRVGRVPDSSMILNISVRAALDRTVNIRSFSWDLNTKLLETVYLGLSQLSKLTSLSIRFPTSRHPRPIYVIPAMPHLRTLRVTDIDPLCYPDDISTLLARSRRLRELTMHWSPRMREFQEPSVLVHDYFRQCTAENLPMKLRKVAFYNFYARRTFDMNSAFEEDLIEDMTFISNSGTGTEESPYHLSFVDRTWLVAPQPNAKCSWKSIRHDTLTKEFCEFLSSVKGLERLIFVNPPRTSVETIQSPRQTGWQLVNTSNPTSQILNGAMQTSAMAGLSRGGSASSSPRSPSTNTSPVLQLRDSFFIPIIASNGATLRNLVLPSRWPLSTSLIARLVRACPNLEQVAMAPEVSAMESFQLLIPFLRRLTAMRILIAPGERSSGVQTVSLRGNSPAPFITLSELADLDVRLHIEKISAISADRDTHSNLKIVGLGHRGFELGEFYQVPVSEAGPTVNGGVDMEDPSRDTTVVVSGSSPNTMSTTLPNRQPLRSPNTSASARSSNAPKSALRKRSWEEASSPKEDSSSDSLCHFTMVVESDNVYETLPSGERVVWRRRVRPASSEVLKRWEIFALDSQDFEPFG